MKLKKETSRGQKGRQAPQLTATVAVTAILVSTLAAAAIEGACYGIIYRTDPPLRGPSSASSVVCNSDCTVSAAFCYQDRRYDPDGYAPTYCHDGSGETGERCVYTNMTVVESEQIGTPQCIFNPGTNTCQLGGQCIDFTSTNWTISVEQDSVNSDGCRRPPDPPQ
jgi:hypothetical protein